MRTMLKSICRLVGRACVIGMVCLPMTECLGQATRAETSQTEGAKEPVLFYWSALPMGFTNFGDELSAKIVSRMIGYPVATTTSRWYGRDTGKTKLLALGSVLITAEEGDAIWGTGVKESFEDTNPARYRFKQLDVRAVRGPLTRAFLLAMGIFCPEIYGDPALLMPRLFPEFKRASHPSKPYSIVVHYADDKYFQGVEHVISAKEDWNVVVEKILDSSFIISTSLHGVIVAEAFGIPARYLRISGKEKLFKFQDYYLGTQRPNFTYAKSVAEALQLGGEEPPTFDEKALYESFPFELYSKVKG